MTLQIAGTKIGLNARGAKVRQILDLLRGFFGFCDGKIQVLKAGYEMQSLKK